MDIVDISEEIPEPSPSPPLPRSTAMVISGYEKRFLPTQEEILNWIEQERNNSPFSGLRERETWSLGVICSAATSDPAADATSLGRNIPWALQKVLLCLWIKWLKCLLTSFDLLKTNRAMNLSQRLQWPDPISRVFKILLVRVFWCHFWSSANLQNMELVLVLDDGSFLQRCPNQTFPPGARNKVFVTIA